MSDVSRKRAHPLPRYLGVLSIIGHFRNNPWAHSIASKRPPHER